MSEQRSDELPFTPYGWAEETPYNRNAQPLSSAELRAFYALREAGEPRLDQLDEVMRSLGFTMARTRDFASVDTFVPGEAFGAGFNNFMVHFTATPNSLSASYVLRPVVQRYEAAYGEHYQHLREITAVVQQEGMRPLTDSERFELFYAYQRMQHLVAESDPDYPMFGEEYLTT